MCNLELKALSSFLPRILQVLATLRWKRENLRHSSIIVPDHDNVLINATNAPPNNISQINLHPLLYRLVTQGLPVFQNRE